MEHTDVLKRAWMNVISYRALWMFGIILALTTGSGGGGGGGTGFYNFSNDDFRDRGTSLNLKPGDDYIKEISEAFKLDVEQANRDMTRFFQERLETDIVVDLIILFSTLLWVVLGIFVIAIMLRYISETALIRMVAVREETGEKVRFGRGIRLGLSRTALRLFLMDLTFGIPILALFLTLAALALALVFFWLLGQTSTAVLSTAAIVLFLTFIFVGFLVWVVLGLLMPFFRRATALDELGVFASIGRGFKVVRQNLKDVGLMWLIMLLIGFLLSIVFVPVTLVVLVSALISAALLGLAVSVPAGIFGGVVVGAVVFLVVLIIPLAIIQGLRVIFYSSVWTITYRELQPRESIEVAEVVKADVQM